MTTQRDPSRAVRDTGELDPPEFLVRLRAQGHVELVPAADPALGLLGIGVGIACWIGSMFGAAGTPGDDPTTILRWVGIVAAAVGAIEVWTALRQRERGEQ
ncbi:MAG TPA: hypothetical protein DCQ64_04880 [Candidatus Rokubacteria bacterium]|nr:hypothetical protein [Candidatus Rokubacteria bacterium]